jgi:hypothetical protein
VKQRTRTREEVVRRVCSSERKLAKKWCGIAGACFASSRAALQ